MDSYQRILLSLFEKLSINCSNIHELPESIGINIDSDIHLNIELLSLPQNDRIILTGEVGPVTGFGSVFDVNALIATGNFYLAKANGCTLSIHEDSQTVYVQYALPLLHDDFEVIQAIVRMLEKIVKDIIDFIKHVRLEGLH